VFGVSAFSEFPFVNIANQYTLTCSVGSYAVTGQNATLTYVNKMQTIWGGARPWDKIVLETKHFEEDDEEQVIMLLIQELAELI
jgi:hypothetical protein